MRFGGIESGFGYNIEREPHNPELSPERIEHVVEDIIESPESMRFIQNKIRMKKEFKESVTYDDDSNKFSAWKRLGIFITHQESLPQDLISILQRHDIDVSSDKMLELHLPPQDIKLTDVGKSFERIREYLRAIEDDGYDLPRYIYGVSYLAGLANRWGFHIVNLPTDIQKNSGAANLLASYATAEIDSKKRHIAEKFKDSDIKLCYISTDEFLEETY